MPGLCDWEQVAAGEVIRIETTGGGGWGDPLERDPARVLRDVRNGLVSDASARADYGVVLDTAQWKVDEVATRALRTDLRRARAWPQPPEVTR